MIIEKPSSEFHRNIAVEFVASLTGENKDTLSRILEEPFWYQHFSSAAKRVGAASEWVAFRLRKLVSEFEKSVIALGLPAHVVRQNPSRMAQHVEQTADRNSEKPNDTEIMFRHLVSRLVTELPIEELRALRLPLGLVFDALDKK